MALVYTEWQKIAAFQALIELEFSIPGGPWEWNHISDIGHAGDEEYQSFEAEAESGMRTRTKSPGIEIPLHFFQGDVHLMHTLSEDLQPLLTLWATNNFPNCRK